MVARVFAVTSSFDDAKKDETHVLHTLLFRVLELSKKAIQRSITGPKNPTGWQFTKSGVLNQSNLKSGFNPEACETNLGPKITT